MFSSERPFSCRSGFAYTGLDHVHAHQMVASCITLESLSLAALWVDSSLICSLPFFLPFLFSYLMSFWWRKICSASYDGKSDDLSSLATCTNFPPSCLPRPGTGCRRFKRKRATTTEQHVPASGMPTLYLILSTATPRSNDDHENERNETNHGAGGVAAQEARRRPRGPACGHMISWERGNGIGNF
jgi:hypothetical protein